MREVLVVQSHTNAKGTNPMNKALVRDAMHVGVISCPVEATVMDAWQLIDRYRIHAVVVTDGPGYLAGIISQTDMLKAWRSGATYEEVMRGPVSAIMTSSVITCMPAMELDRAIKLINRNHIHRLVVVEERNDGRVWPTGILSMSDIVRHIEEHER
jgi:CBS domain-containing protein